MRNCLRNTETEPEHSNINAEAQKNWEGDIWSPLWKPICDMHGFTLVSFTTLINSRTFTGLQTPFSAGPITPSAQREEQEVNIIQFPHCGAVRVIKRGNGLWICSHTLTAQVGGWGGWKGTIDLKGTLTSRPSGRQQAGEGKCRRLSLIHLPRFKDKPLQRWNYKQDDGSFNRDECARRSVWASMVCGGGSFVPVIELLSVAMASDTEPWNASVFRCCVLPPSPVVVLWKKST